MESVFDFNNDLQTRKFIFSLYVPSQEILYIDDFQSDIIETKNKKIESKTFRIQIDRPTTKYISVKNLDVFYSNFRTYNIDVEKLLSDIEMRKNIRMDHFSENGMLFNYEYYKDIFHESYIKENTVIIDDIKIDDIINEYQKILRKVGDLYVKDKEYFFCSVLINKIKKYYIGINIIVNKDNEFDEIENLRYNDIYAQYDVVKDGKKIDILINEKR